MASHAATNAVRGGVQFSQDGWTKLVLISGTSIYMLQGERDASYGLPQPRALSDLALALSTTSGEGTNYTESVGGEECTEKRRDNW